MFWILGIGAPRSLWKLIPKIQNPNPKCQIPADARDGLRIRYWDLGFAFWGLELPGRLEVVFQNPNPNPKFRVPADARDGPGSLGFAIWVLDFGNLGFPSGAPEATISGFGSGSQQGGPCSSTFTLKRQPIPKTQNPKPISRIRLVGMNSEFGFWILVENLFMDFGNCFFQTWRF